MNTTNVGDELTCEFQRPFSQEVQSKLTAQHPQCPLGIMALGITRIKNKDSPLEVNSLTKEGARLRIRLQG